MQIATKENTTIGTRVLRNGPNWEYYDQGEGSAYGIVEDFHAEGWVWVNWYDENNESMGNGNTYRIGGRGDNRFDLYLANELSLNGNIKNNG